MDFTLQFSLTLSMIKHTSSLQLIKQFGREHVVLLTRSSYWCWEPFSFFHILSPNFTTTISGPLTSFHSFANHCGWQKNQCRLVSYSKLRKCWWILLDINFTIQETNILNLPWNFWSFKSNHPFLSIKSKFLIGLFNGETSRPRGKLRKVHQKWSFGPLLFSCRHDCHPDFSQPTAYP